ncbi:A24 family peptidase [Staphylococcus sp. 17KM0847]|uniref:prepilin peptidase n=1 Tax=Staphylococcus sp. 17KM0847 TaxID=2583989 RepID=UPI0035B600A3
MGSCVMSFLMFVAEVRMISFDLFFKRSICQCCQRRLIWLDLIPIVSFIFLKGRCRYCNQHIPLKLLIAEIMGGTLTLIPFYFPLYLHLNIFYITAFILLTLSFVDIERLVIPHRFLILLLFSNALLLWPTSISFIQYSLLFIMIVCSYLFNSYIGMGDFKLLCVLIILFPPLFIAFIIWLMFPLGVLVMLGLRCLGLLHLPYVPLVPAICISFICTAIMYPQFVFFIGGTI